MKTIYAAAIKQPIAPELVAPLRLTNAGNDEATVEFFDNYGTGTKLKIRRATDQPWQVWDFSTVTLQEGEFVEICGENSECTNMLGKFELTGTIEASGSIMSMIYGESTNARNQLKLTFNAFGYYDDNSGDEDGMFYGCTGLTAAPELPATTLAAYCYQGMFNGCTGLTAAPELPATTLAAYCYQDMFYGCTGIEEITVGFTAWDDDNSATDNWLDSVAAAGTFTCPAGLDTTTRDSSHVPENWTVVNA